MAHYRISYQKNEDYCDQLTLEEFIESQPETEHSDLDYEEEIEYGSDLANLLGTAALDNEFNIDQVRIIQDLVIRVMPNEDNLERCDYLIEKVHLMESYKPQNRFKYLCNMIKNEIK